jgi:hypothetical protein
MVARRLVQAFVFVAVWVSTKQAALQPPLDRRGRDLQRGSHFLQRQQPALAQAVVARLEMIGARQTRDDPRIERGSAARPHATRIQDGRDLQDGVVVQQLVVRMQRMPREQWFALIPDAHTGYISWDEYESNQRRLHESAKAIGTDRHRGPAREGPALLQGLVLCGRCGRRMSVGYHSRHGQLYPEYRCMRERIHHGEAVCQHVPGAGVDQAIGALLVEVTLQVQRELQSRLEEADCLRHAQVGRAQYECDLAQRRYMRVDPDNRLVADSLEAHWNETLRALSAAHEEYARRREQDAHVLTNEQHRAILALASDFPRLWSDPATPDRERKRMVRLLLEDVTLNRGEQISLQVRFKGGACRTLHLPLPLRSWQIRLTPAAVIDEIARVDAPGPTPSSASTTRSSPRASSARCVSSGAPARSCSSTTPARRWVWPMERARRSSSPPWAPPASPLHAPRPTRACARGSVRWRAR